MMPILTIEKQKQLLTGQNLEGVELFNNAVIGGNLLTREEFDRLIQADQGKQKIEDLITLRSSLIEEWRLRWASRGSLLIALAVSIGATTVPGVLAVLMVLTASAIGMVGVGSWMYRGIDLMPEINKEMGQLLGNDSIKFNDSATMTVQALSIFYDAFLNQRKAEIQAIINSVVTGNAKTDVAVVNALGNSTVEQEIVAALLFSNSASKSVPNKPIPTTANLKPKP